VPLPDEMSHWGYYDNMTWDQCMVFNAARPSFVQHNEDEAGPNIVAADDYAYEQDLFTEQHVTQLDDKWVDIMKNVDRPLFDGSSES